MRSSVRLFGLAVLSLWCQACGLTDDPFVRGKGRITGRIGGLAAGQALVSWVGQDWDSPAVTGDDDGRFVLDNVDVGDRELIVRAPEQNKAVRLPVRVAAGITSNLGSITLEDVPALTITVRDPDLPIYQARIRVAEIPGLQTATAENGDATLASIPASGCYTPQVTVERFPFQFANDSCVPYHDWVSNILQIHPLDEQTNVRTQVYHASVRLQEVLQPVTACTSDCQFPSWWLDSGDPPCPRPINTLAELNDTARLESLILAIGATDLFSSGPFDLLVCPDSDLMQALCATEGCSMALSSIDANIEAVASGIVTDGCLGPGLTVPVSQDELQAITGPDCLQIGGSYDFDTKVRYVFMQATAGLERISLKLVAKEGDVLRLFYEGSLAVDWEHSSLTLGQAAWSLHRLEFLSDPPPAPGKTEGRIAWINPI